MVRTANPRPTAASATWPPTKPVAPVTRQVNGMSSVFGICAVQSRDSRFFLNPPESAANNSSGGVTDFEITAISMARSHIFLWPTSEKGYTIMFKKLILLAVVLVVG